MEKYISKDALVAEFIKRIDDYWSDSENTMGMYHYALEEVIKYINTLEVKEMNLEKIINEYFKDWKFDDELDIMVKPNNYSASFKDLKVIAKHFFELGLKMNQKGEEYES